MSMCRISFQFCRAFFRQLPKWHNSCSYAHTTHAQHTLAYVHCLRAYFNFPFLLNAHLKAMDNPNSNQVDSTFCLVARSGSLSVTHSLHVRLNCAYFASSKIAVQIRSHWCGAIQCRLFFSPLCAHRSPLCDTHSPLFRRLCFDLI